MRRDHPVGMGPETVDHSRTVAKDAPEAWQPYGVTGKVDVLPLTDERAGVGWCTYRDTLDEGPDVEWISGGLNHKHPEAAAIWRQGFLLHFGFQPAPDALNANGKALLVNSIVYAAGFRGDRPLLRTPSGFVAKETPRPRRYLRSALKAKPPDPAPDPKVILANFDPALHAELGKLETAALVRWCEEHMDWLRAGPNGSLVLDADAERLGAAIGTRAGIERCLAKIGDETLGAAATRVLERAIPEGPGAGAAGSAWAEWWRANADYVFFSELASQTWHVDPLARARKVPTAELRGPARRDVDQGNGTKYKTGMLQPGDKAPDFSVPDETGKTRKLGDYAGKHLVIWWYPKADTPG